MIIGDATSIRGPVYLICTEQIARKTGPSEPRRFLMLRHCFLLSLFVPFRQESRGFTLRKTLRVMSSGAFLVRIEKRQTRSEKDTMRHRFSLSSHPFLPCRKSLAGEKEGKGRKRPVAGPRKCRSKPNRKLSGIFSCFSFHRLVGFRALLSSLSPFPFFFLPSFLFFFLFLSFLFFPPSSPALKKHRGSFARQVADGL